MNLGENVKKFNLLRSRILFISLVQTWDLGCLLKIIIFQKLLKIFFFKDLP